jgi:thiosulfate/3-mercaptopyruvate sulfurtransferase
MIESTSPIIKVSDLSVMLGHPDLVVIDASNGTDARSNYLSEHINEAQFVGLNTQLADIKKDASKGGRHPLPSLKQFSHVLAGLGISPESHVVIYDDNSGANAAARFWWMLKAINHQKVQVLDGGLHAAKKYGIAMSHRVKSSIKSDPYSISKWILPITRIDEVEKAMQDDSRTIIDVRSSPRYNGETEPIDLIAGHIPSAINIPFSENLDEHGLFLSPAVLREKYDKVINNETIIHCGSGVTACHTLLAIAYAGLDIPKLYVGSWSEWSRNNKSMVLN